MVWLVGAWAVAGLVGQATGQNLKTVMHATWAHTPLLLEASEFLGSIENGHFFRFVDALADSPKPTTDRDEAGLALQRASSIVDSSVLGLLNLSLALREFSPAVEADHQLALHALEGVAGGCGDADAFVVVAGGTVLCARDTLKQALSALTGAEPIIYDFDHVMHGTGPHVAILYGHVASSTFHTLYGTLKAQAEETGLTYVVRHYVKGRSSTVRPRLSGYGIELAIKNMEYKAVDDRTISDDDSDIYVKAFAEEEAEWEDDADDQDIEGLLFARLKEQHPALSGSLEGLRQHMLKAAEITPVKEWETQDLGMQTAARVVRAGHGPGALRVLRDIVQNLPSRAVRLIKDKVPKELSDEVEGNRGIAQGTLGVDPQHGLFLVNGVRFSPNDVGPFQISEQLRKDAQMHRLLKGLDVPDRAISELMQANDPHLIDDPDATPDLRVDIRSDEVFWLNDLETDSEYQGLPRSIHELNQRTHYNQPHKLARNLVHAVFVLPPTHPSLARILDVIRAYVRHQAPLRFGFIFITPAAMSDPEALTFTQEGTGGGTEDVDSKVLRIMQFLREKGSRVAFDWLQKVFTHGGQFTDKALKDRLAGVAGLELGSVGYEAIVGADSAYDSLRAASDAYALSTGLGLASPAHMYINGKQLHLDLNSLDSAMFNAIRIFQNEIKQAMWQGEVTDDMGDFLGWFGQRHGAVSRINPLVTRAATSMPPMVLPRDTRLKLKQLAVAEQMGSIISRLKYLSGDVGGPLHHDVTHIVVADLSTPKGLWVAYEALARIQDESSNGVRVGLVAHSEAGTGRDVGVALHAAVSSQPQPQALQFALALLPKVYEAVRKGQEVDVGALAQQAAAKAGLVVEAYEDALKSHALREALDEGLYFVRSLLKLTPGQTAVITNGKVLGPLGAQDCLVRGDLELAEARSRQWVASLVPIVQMHSPENRPIGDLLTADRLVGILSVLGMQATRRMHSALPLRGDHSMVHIPMSRDAPTPVSIVLVADPLTKPVQRLIQPIMALQSSLGAEVRLYLLPKAKLSGLPLTRFYRYAVHTAPVYANDGRLLGPTASFSDLPREPLLTLAVDGPPGWDVEAVSSVHDLDNIHLKSVAGPGVFAAFDLSHILVEGRCVDSHGEPTRGLALCLGRPGQEPAADTLVMANLGYFQIKGRPGVWQLSIRPGRSLTMYSLLDGANATTVTMRSFSSVHRHIKVKKRPGKEGEDLLAEVEKDRPVASQQDGALSEADKKQLQARERQGQTINVFSLASGHLYERFLAVMMLSVRRHTDHPVKFWLLENPLSPKFKRFLPHLAAKYGFEYQFVSYNWPFWLNPQTEKQRIIWAYKILFLDVLFPQDIKRVIFVDADQTVRADLWELMTMDLHGAPYGYTPFCSNRPDMAKYRFWDQGYWANHLQGRAYHISALYVIDLVRFRQVAAGDSLRTTYHQLSQDPNSLANLDQDLPNQMIHQLPIFSLPQEWLWCETWCSNKTKPRAKTIDLCNNPETKEPKLQAAVRIVSEWTDLDGQVAALQDEVFAAQASRRQAATHRDEL